MSGHTQRYTVGEVEYNLFCGITHIADVAADLGIKERSLERMLLRWGRQDLLRKLTGRPHRKPRTAAQRARRKESEALTNRDRHAPRLSSRFSDATVAEMRRQKADGVPVAQLSVSFGISQTYLYSILTDQARVVRLT